MDRRLVEKIEGVDATDGYGAVHQVLRSGIREVEDEIRAEVEQLYGVARVTRSSRPLSTPTRKMRLRAVGSSGRMPSRQGTGSCSRSSRGIPGSRPPIQSL